MAKHHLRITRYQPATLAFFQKKEEAGEAFSADELSRASGYPLQGSLMAKISREEFGEFLVEQGDGLYRAQGTVGLTVQQFAHRTSSHYRRTLRETASVERTSVTPSHAWSENSIKGRVAETIVQELFLAHGFNVFHYGMERSVPGIAQLTRKTNGAVKERIRTMPDFVVQDPRNHRLHFVEVKYRSNGTFGIDDVAPDYPWPHAYFILVSKEHIKCLTYAQLQAGKAIAPRCNNLLIKRVDLGLDRSVIVRFGTLVKKFFAGI